MSTVNRYTSDERLGVKSRAKGFELLRGEPAIYYVLEDGRTAAAFLGSLSYDELKQLENGKAKILRRRQRRAAFRLAKQPWPVGGGVPPHADYARA